jgi:hypothetical protein
MTDENKLIDEVLYSLKVPPKQTFQNKRSMRRSEKNINRNLYDDVLKPLGKLTGGQAKIDMNKNNKIDAEDFKMLRGEEPKKLNRGGGIAIKGTNFKGVF